MPNTHIALTSDGIVVSDFGRFPQLTKELLEKTFARRKRIAKGPRPVMVVIGGAFSATPAAHRFASSHNYGDLTTALAMVGDYAVCEELFSLFTQLDKPPFPCRYFDHTDPAFVWLRTFL
ncbi:MAG: hypothetical protein ABI777_05670 [Betaproteobacteria bacterium]